MAENQVQFEDEVYDPYKYRQKKKHVSDIYSFGNLVKSAAGTGLFAMPYAFSNVGLLFGIIGTIVMGIIITISLQLLVRTHYTMCVRTKRPMLNYDEVVAAAMTTGIMKGRISHEIIVLIVDTVMLICYMGIGAVYVVFVSGIVQECIDSEKTVGEAYYALILVPFCLLLNMVKGLHVIAPLSIIGNIFLITAGIVGIVYSFKDQSSYNWMLIQPDIEHYPKFIGIIFFSLCSPGLVLAIEHSMQNPWNYTKSCGVLNWGMTTLVLVHIIIGSVGYYKWGNAALSNFIQNHYYFDVPTLMALIMQALGIFFSYGLQCYIPISILSEAYARKSINDGYLSGTHHVWDIFVRISVTLITCIFAAAIPKLHLFTNIVGSLCVAILGFVFPMILYIITNCGNYGAFHWKLFATLFIFIIGLIAMSCATVSSVISIINYFKE